MSNEDSVNAFYLWNGAVYVTPLLGGYIADSILGRYKTILVFSIVYVIGLGLFLFGSIPTSLQPTLIFLGMYVVALGAGGIKPNCSTMGADQFDPQYEQDKKEAKQFFSYFYWSINLGALIAYTLVAYICQYGIPFLGGESWGFFVGYTIPTIMLAVGVMVFMSGSRIYKKNAPQGSMVTTAVAIVYEAVVSRRHVQLTESTVALLPHDSNSNSSDNEYNQQDRDSLLKQKEISSVSTSAAAGGAVADSGSGGNRFHWLDRASMTHGGSHSPNDVESVKYLTRLIPFLAVMIPYWGIYGQTKTAFQIQGCQMNVYLGSLELPVSAMNIFNNITILALVPLFDQVLFPLLRRKNIDLTMLKKIGLGFILAMAAMIMAALIEIYRVQDTPPPGTYLDQAARDNISPCRKLNNYDPFRYQEWFAGEIASEPANCWKTCDAMDQLNPAYLSIACIACDNIPQMSRVSILWQVPQFVLIGISEIFASITSLEFFYSQAPSSMRSVSQAMNLFTNALGSWLTIPLTLLVNINAANPWVASNVDEGHLDYYYILLAALMFLALLVFVWLSAGFEYADPVVLESLAGATGAGGVAAELHDDDNDSGCNEDGDGDVDHGHQHADRGGDAESGYGHSLSAEVETPQYGRSKSRDSSHHHIYSPVVQCDLAEN